MFFVELFQKRTVFLRTEVRYKEKAAYGKSA